MSAAGPAGRRPSPTPGGCVPPGRLVDPGDLSQEAHSRRAEWLTPAAQHPQAEYRGADSLSPAAQRPEAVTRLADASNPVARAGTKSPAGLAGRP